MPNHSFYTITYHSADAFEKAKAKPFAVEADAGTKTVRFTCEIDRESPLNRRARASINGDLITFKGDAARVKLLYTFVGIAGKSGVFGLQQTPKGLQLLDFWRRPLKEKMQLNDVEVVLYDQSALQPCDDLLRELASVTRERFDHFGLPRPTIWVRPGGWCPGVAWERLERIYGREFGYSGADSRVGKDVVKGMNRWTTGYDEMYFFDQGADITPEQLIDRIAPRIAAGEYHVTLSHMWYRKLPGGFDEYCRKTEEFVRLLNARKIPTLTMVDVLNQRFGRP